MIENVNNGPTVKNSWDINRPHPTRNGAVVTPPPVVPPPVAPPPADSPSNTYVNSAGPTLVIGGITCGINSAGNVTINGSPDTGTSNVIGILSYGGKFYQQQSGQWWQCKDAAPKVGSEYATAVDPRQPVTTPPPATVVKPTGATIHMSDGSNVETVVKP